MNQDILDLTIRTSMTKIQNLKMHVAELKSKLERLEKEIQTTERSIQTHVQHIALVGQKKNPLKGSTPEQTDTIKKHNNSVYEIKLRVIKESFPEYYSLMEESMPEALKDKNVPL